MKRSILVALILVLISPCTAGQESIPVEDGPTIELKLAYWTYARSKKPKLADERLRQFVFSLADDHVQVHRRRLHASDWPQEFKEMFDGAVQWKRATLEKGPDHLYRLSEEYRLRPDARINGYDVFSYELLQRAAKAGHERARRALSYRKNPLRTPEHIMKMRRFNHQFASKNDPEFQKHLAIDYVYQPLFVVDLMKSYYWMLRARDGGADISPGPIWDRLRLLSDEDRKQVHDWISNGQVPDP